MPSFTDRRRLEKIYREAVYVVRANDGEVSFKIGEISPALERILREANAENFAFITAFNPRSKKLSDAENESRQAELIEILRREGYKFLPSYGTDENRNWQPEESLFILDITEAKAREIVRLFEQNAFVYGEKNKPPVLIWAD